MKAFTLLLFVINGCNFTFALNPQDSETRERLSLNGLWDFVRETSPDIGMQEQWYRQRLANLAGAEVMPVPSSYNDVTQDADLRDHVGVTWYQRCVLLPRRFTDFSRRVVVHFDSVHYNATVWLNGEQITQHEGGHLPFEVEVNGAQLVRTLGGDSCFTVSVNNTLTPRTLPQGRLVTFNDTTRYPPGYVKQMLDFDFFNFAGIQRSVTLYTTPPGTYLRDVKLRTELQTSGDQILIGEVHYEIDVRGWSKYCYYNIAVLDADDEVVTKISFSRELRGNLQILSPRLWWPHLAHNQRRRAHLYTLQVQLMTINDEVLPYDVYRLKFGLRSIAWNHENIFINNEPLYFRGFGRHEDSNVHGRGLDEVLVWHDGYLLQWLGANSYRTSHYPYSEESLDVADLMGFVVIAATPSIGLKTFTRRMLRKHVASAKELIARDKNRACVIMWSLSNEPLSQMPAADDYFRQLAEAVATFDPTRPITIVTSQRWNNDVAVQHVDVVSVNRYAGWYGDGGHLDLVDLQTEAEMTRWHEKFAKPVLMSEYGAGALSGFHAQPSAMWTEDYQADLFRRHFEAFDKLHSRGFFIGEIVWNFADFATPQEVIRPTGCMKGVLTRDRKPKEAAHVIRRRFITLARRHCEQLHRNFTTYPEVREFNCSAIQI